MYVGTTNKPVGMPKPDCKPEEPENPSIMRIDGFLSTTSTNPVQNKVITDAIKSIKKLTKVTIDESLNKYNDLIIGDIDSVIKEEVNKEIESGVIKDTLDGLQSDISEIDNKHTENINNILAQLEELKEKVESGGGSGGGGSTEPSYTPITATLSAVPAGGSYKIGETITPTLTWTSSQVPQSVTLTGCNISDFDITAKGGTYTMDSITNDKTYTLKVSDGRTTVTKSVSYKFVDSYFYGVADTNDPELIDLATLESGIEDGSNHTIRVTAEGQYVVFVTPLEILSIKDANNFENISDFKETKVGNYYYYITYTPKTFNKYKYIFISQED